MADNQKKQRLEEGRVQKGGNNEMPANPPPQNLRPTEPPPSTGNTPPNPSNDSGNTGSDGSSIDSSGNSS